MYYHYHYIRKYSENIRHNYYVLLVFGRALDLLGQRYLSQVQAEVKIIVIELEYLLWVGATLVSEALFSESMPHFGHHLGHLDGVRSQLSRL